MNSRLHAYIGTFRQLEILLALHDEGSVRGAAEKLNLTQPTVSMQLKKLSEAIELPLYVLSGRRIRFTDAGSLTVKSARAILEHCEQLDMELAKLKGVTAGTLRLAVVTTAKYAVPHLVGPFCEKWPDIDLKLTVGNREEIINRMEAGKDDFYVFSHLPSEPDFESIEFLPNPLVAVCNEQHELAKHKNVTLNDLTSFPFLLREKGSGTRFAIEKFCIENGIHLNTKMTIESNEAIKHCVMAGLGFSILSAHTLAFGERNNLKIIEVDDLPITTQWSFTWLKQKKQSPLAELFLSYVLEEGQSRLLEELHLEDLGIQL